MITPQTGPGKKTSSMTLGKGSDPLGPNNIFMSIQLITRGYTDLASTKDTAKSMGIFHGDIW